MSPEQEKELLLRIAKGDEKAFEELFHAWHQKLGAFVLGWTKSHEMAEEIVQDVFLKLWINRASLVEVNKFDSYLFIMSRNHSFNALRQSLRERNRKKEWLQNLAEDSEFDPLDSPPDYMPMIEQAINDLPEQQKKVYLLRSREKLRYEEIAESMGISPDTARKHLVLANKFIIGHVKKNLPIIILVLGTQLVLVAH